VGVFVFICVSGQCPAEDDLTCGWLSFCPIQWCWTTG